MKIKKNLLGIAGVVAVVSATLFASTATANTVDPEPTVGPAVEAPAITSKPANAVAPLACSITAHTPYASGNRVWTGGHWSGCASPVDVYLMWDRPGPDTPIGVKSNATSNWNYGWDCNWGTPQNRKLFGKAEDNNGAFDDTTHLTFTSAHTNCVL